MSNDERLLNITEVCKLLGVTQPTFRSLSRKVALPYYLVGTRKRFVASEILEALRGCSEGGKGQAEEHAGKGRSRGRGRRSQGDRAA